jgi:hypothetical protein
MKSQLKLIGAWALFASAFVLVNILFFPEDLGFLQVRPHPYWVIIIAFALRHNWQEASTAAFLTIGLHQYFLYSSNQLLDVEQMFEISNLVQVGSFFALATVISLKIQGLNGFIDHLKQELAKSKEATTRVERNLDAQKELTRYLQSRVSASNHGYANIYRISAKLNSLDERGILEGVFEVLTLLQVERAGWYVVNEDGTIRLENSLGQTKGHPLPEELSKADPLVRRAVNEKNVVWTQENSEKQSLFLFLPLVHEGVVRGVLGVERMAFLSFNQETIEILQVMRRWWMDSWAAMIESRKKSNHILYRVNDEMFSLAYFQVLLNRNISDAKRYQTTFSVLRLWWPDLKDWDAKQLRAWARVQVQAHLRSGDLYCLGRSKEESFIFLSHTPVGGANVVLDKLEQTIRSFAGKSIESWRGDSIEFKPEMDTAESVLSHFPTEESQ